MTRLAALTLLVVIALALLGGLMLFVYFTANPASPDSRAKAMTAYNWWGSNYPTYTEPYWRKLSTHQKTDRDYALWTLCFEYNDQLACNEFDALQQSGQEVGETR